jgi:4-diphosphocytidyl-2-C-methyl-D-erythritol kinase
MGAGLGGGSADGSFTLTALNKLFELNIPNSKLEKLANEIGSDCPFFIENTVKYVSGTGEKMVNHSLSLKGNFIKLVNPNIHISTQSAFKGITPIASSQNLTKTTLNTLNQANNDIFNDFEKTVFPQHPILSNLKNKLKEEDPFYTSMTGTGSTMYALYKTKPASTFTDFTEEIFEL